MEVCHCNNKGEGRGHDTIKPQTDRNACAIVQSKNTELREIRKVLRSGMSRESKE